MWEVCLPASSSSSSPNSRNRQGRLQLRRERESKQAVPARGGVGWRRGLEREARSRQARDTHTQARRGTDTPTLTHSHTLGLVPAHHPPCTDTQTLSANPANPHNTLWTHTEIQALAPTLHPPTNRVGSRQQPEGGEGNGGRKTAGIREDVQPKPWEPGYQLPHACRSQNPVSQDNPGHLARGLASFPHSPKPLPPERGVGHTGQVEITTFIRHRDRITFPITLDPRHYS